VEGGSASVIFGRSLKIGGTMAFACRWRRSDACVLRRELQPATSPRGIAVDGIVYLVGLVVIVMFILSFLGLR
jgi:hypothetical protein